MGPPPIPAALAMRAQTQASTSAVIVLGVKANLSCTPGPSSLAPKSPKLLHGDLHGRCPSSVGARPLQANVVYK